MEMKNLITVLLERIEELAVNNNFLKNENSNQSNQIAYLTKELNEKIDKTLDLADENDELKDENDELKEQLAKLKESTQPKQNDENILVIPEDFILHDGVECPDFPDNCKIQTISRWGIFVSGAPKNFRWNHGNHFGDIIAYKITE